MLKKLTCSFGLIFLISAGALAQSRILYIGDAELRLGMPRDAAMKAFAKYKVEVVGGYEFCCIAI